MTDQITPNSDVLLDQKEFNFRFKKDKLGNQRQPVTLTLPVPSVEGIVAILEKGGKGLELLLDVVADTIRSAAASFVSEDEKISQATFPVDKILWDAIANAPRAERKSIAPELWEAFAADYIEVMPAVTSKSVEVVTNATLVYLKKFSIVKTNKSVLTKLADQLALYVEHSPRASEFTEIIELLNSKLETYLQADEIEQLISNL